MLKTTLITILLIFTLTGCVTSEESVDDTTTSLSSSSSNPTTDSSSSTSNSSSSSSSTDTIAPSSSSSSSTSSSISTSSSNSSTSNSSSSSSSISSTSSSSSTTNKAPTASNVQISGVAKTGSTLRLTYTFEDADSDSEGASIIAWSTPTKELQRGASRTFTIPSGYEGDSIGAWVHPVDSRGLKSSIAYGASNNMLKIEPLVDKDTTKPTLTLIGANPQQLTVGDNYTELGATATDNIDGNLTSEITIDALAVDTSKEGSYRVKYSVEDSAKNRVEVVRVVKVNRYNSINEKKWPKHIRGLNVAVPQKFLETSEPYERMSSWGVNAITINFGTDKKLSISQSEAFRSPAVPKNMEAYRGGLDRLDKIVKLAKKYEFYIILQTAVTVGYDGINVATGESLEANAIQEREYIQNVIDLTVFIANRYKNEPTLLAYNFIAEPHTKWIVDNWSGIVVPKFVDAIRAVDMNSYLVFSAGLWGFPDFGSSKKGRIKEPVKDPADKIVYGWHDYAPHNYTHQGIHGRPKGLVYPGLLRYFNTSAEKYWDRRELVGSMKRALDFMKKYKVRMFVNEFGVARWAPGAAQLLDDKISIFEEYGIDWTCFQYGGGWDGWNLTVDKDLPPKKRTDGYTNTDRLEVVKKYLLKNKNMQ